MKPLLKFLLGFFALPLILLSIANAFTVFTPPTVTSPNGGESWKPNSTYTIKWKTGSEVSNVKIELLKSGKAYKTITKSTKNDGKHDWKIPASVTNGSAYKIKITVTNKATLADQSNKSFTISSKASKSSGGKTLKVTTPNGGQKWTSGKKYTLKWSKGNAGRFVKIELLKSGKAYKTIHKRTKNDGRHRWSIPSTIATGSAYKIKITSTSKANVKDQSDKNFKITKAGRSKSRTANVSGSWAGTFVSYNGQKGAVTGKFVQKGNTFSGPLRLYGSPCFSYEFATGTISGSEIVFGIINDAIIIEASVKESTISGVYYVYKSPWGYCTGDSGTLVLRRY